MTDQEQIAALADECDRQGHTWSGKPALVFFGAAENRRDLSSAVAERDEQIAALQAQLDAVLEALSHVVAQANVNAVGGEFIERYDMPVGSIHKAIPLLAQHGIVVDIYGYVHRSPVASGVRFRTGLGHDFEGVAGHPDDDECTHREDGTDRTYCGQPADAHGYDTELATSAPSDVLDRVKREVAEKAWYEGYDRGKVSEVRPCGNPYRLGTTE